MNTCHVCGQAVALAESGRGAKSWMERHVVDGKVCAGSFRTPRQMTERPTNLKSPVQETFPGPSKQSRDAAGDAVGVSGKLVEAATTAYCRITAKVKPERQYISVKPRKPSDEVAAFVLEEGEGTLWGCCLKRYFPLKLNLRSDSTRSYYRRAIKSFGVFLGRQPLLADLNDDTVTMWLKWLLESGDNRVNTKRERVGRILTLWSWCAKRRLVEQFPTVCRPREQESVPHAWTVEQLAKLFKAASEEPGHIASIPSGDWWSAWLAFVFWTAERYGAAMAVRWEWIDLDRGVASIPAEVRKGGTKNGTYHLAAEVVGLLRKIRTSDTGVAFPWPYCESMYYIRFGNILKRAGLPTGRKCKTHCLRATHATIRTVLGGDAAKALMHSDPETTRKHYIDPTHLPPDVVKLPTPWGHDQPSAAPFNNSAVIAMELPADEAKALPRARRVAG